MAPDSTVDERLNSEINEDVVTQNQKTLGPEKKFEILYLNWFYFGYFHIVSLYGTYLSFTSAKWATIAFALLVHIGAILGITAGAHRLWSHKSYKAKRPLEILLMLLNSLVFQYTILYWARDHRVHHKFCDTDGDPHNASRGFFFSHIGWLLTRKNKEVSLRGKCINMSDLNKNPVLQFQKKYAVPVFASFSFILPTVIPMYFWGETFNNAWHINALRYTITLNTTFLVNSAAHKWGYRPYDKTILPAQNLGASLLTLGEGFHNYHHVFPWDYKTAELGNNYLNVTTLFINFFAKIGWAYDLKAVSEEMIGTRAERTGDGTDLWGWDDKEITDFDKKVTQILFKDS